MNNALVTECEVHARHLLRREALAVVTPRCFVKVKGVDLAVHDSDPRASKIAIVCLHAIGHGGGDFAAFGATFSKTFRIITVDWPGHGASATDGQPVSARRYATLLGDLLDTLELTRPILLGNSIGGSAAIEVAINSPARVRGLVLCNPGGLDKGGFLAKLFIRYLLSRFRWGVQEDPRFQGWYKKYYTSILLGAAVAARREAIVEAGYEMAPRLMEAWNSFMFPQADLRQVVNRLRIPVFIGWAMKDRLVQWHRNRLAVQSIPTVQVVRFERSGHSPFLEEPVEFHHRVAPFLASLREEDEVCAPHV
jgi:4,5:9,10-diseco-3-hydroxy-5,9,17-trioxoandrosta-1(10),2-diene-4-oate hydrolase